MFNLKMSPGSRVLSLAAADLLPSTMVPGDMALPYSGNAKSTSPSTIAPHVLLLPFPSQGHINPMLQFAKRLVSRGPKVSLVTTNFIINSTKTELGPVELKPISDGYDEGGVAASPNLDFYLKSLEDFGSKTLRELIDRHASSDQPFTCIVFDTCTPWAVSVARKAGLKVVAFSTQSAAAISIYYYVNEGVMETPRDGQKSEPAFGLPSMHRWEFPSMSLKDGSYPMLSMLALGQFENLEPADWVLINTSEELELPVITALKEHWIAKTIGPTVPSMLIDASITDDYDYGLNLLQPEESTCLLWLSERPPRSVVYVSFGSYLTLSANQMGELADALMGSPTHFLWLVRASELGKLPDGFGALASAAGKGLVVTWCPQPAVLTHLAIGCFVTHCGWNSTLEALSIGVPMVAVPQWTDQPTNAKYVEDVWGVGVRVGVDGEGVASGEEIGRCIGEVMGGEERGKNVRANARKWKEKVRRAHGQGGSSDENLNDFVKFLRDI